MKVYLVSKIVKSVIYIILNSIDIDNFVNYTTEYIHLAAKTRQLYLQHIVMWLLRYSKSDTLIFFTLSTLLFDKDQYYKYTIKLLVTISKTSTLTEQLYHSNSNPNYQKLSEVSKIISTSRILSRFNIQYDTIILSECSLRDNLLIKHLEVRDA